MTKSGDNSNSVIHHPLSIIHYFTTVISLLFTTAALAQPGASIGMSKGNPVLEKFNPSITFFASFDGHSKADLSCGKGKPIGNSHKLRWEKGKWGKALVGRTRDIIYPVKDNINLRRSGSVILWIRPIGWQGGKNKHPKQIAFFNIRAQGLSLYLARQGGPSNHEALMAIYGPHIGNRHTRSLIKNGSSRYWTKSQWHLLVMNWNDGHVALSVDGGVFKLGGKAKIAPPNSSSTHSAGHMYFAAGATKTTPYLMDGLTILDRPLSNKEVKALYQASTHHTAAGYK